MLFAADPDLGFDPNANSSSLLGSVNGRATGGASQLKGALSTYFALLAALLRLLLSTFLSFGAENEKMIYLMRSFLQDYRGNMVGVFKRAAGLNLSAQQGNQSVFEGSIGANGRELRKYVDECMTAYTGLAYGCDFMDFEDERGLGGNGIASVGLGKSVNGGFT